MKLQLLGGLTVRQFLRDHWHKQPLLVRNAIPGFTGLLSPGEMMDLACREGVESRLVRQAGGWSLGHGPFKPADFRKLPRRDWTLLVQSLDHHLASGAALLEQFTFIPRARLDDLMVSYAAPGGGVGPHFDSYDVFLLQGMGHRRWRISAQENLDLVEGLPLKILSHFEPEAEYVLGPGDMLYLPPRYAHDGIAEDECMTYSIGFRAPSFQELGEGFLNFLHDELELPGRYADPDLAAQKHSGEIPTAMLAQIEEHLAQIRWDEDMAMAFVGRYFSEPKPEVFFTPPARPLGKKAFAARLAKHGFKLDAKSRLLFSGTQFFINGEDFGATGPERKTLMLLSDTRALPPGDYGDALTGLLYEWYLAGWGGIS
jgi:50S ribosomal protein L16 3-hydroxylase